MKTQDTIDAAIVSIVAFIDANRGQPGAALARDATATVANAIRDIRAAVAGEEPQG